MNAQLKTVLLTVLTLSCFAIALVELSGVSSTALYNKYGIAVGAHAGEEASNQELSDRQKRESEVRAMPKTTIVFDTTKFNFGNIAEGQVVKHAFHFRNTGTNPLKIYDAVASCGCTVPSYPKEPILPGGEGDIQVQFNSANREGHQTKNIMIYSNAQDEAMSIGFEAEVKKK